MNCPGHKFFACASFSSYQYSGVGVGNGLDHRKDFLHGLASANDIFELVLFGQALAEQDVFGDQLLMFNDSFQHQG